MAAPFPFFSLTVLKSVNERAKIIMKTTAIIGLIVFASALILQTKDVISQNEVSYSRSASFWFSAPLRSKVIEAPVELSELNEILQQAEINSSGRLVVDKAYVRAYSDSEYNIDSTIKLHYPEVTRRDKATKLRENALLLDQDGIALEAQLSADLESPSHETLSAKAFDYKFQTSENHNAQIFVIGFLPPAPDVIRNQTLLDSGNEMSPTDREYFENFNDTYIVSGFVVIEEDKTYQLFSVVGSYHPISGFDLSPGFSPSLGEADEAGITGDGVLDVGHELANSIFDFAIEKQNLKEQLDSKAQIEDLSAQMRDDFVEAATQLSALVRYHKGVFRQQKITSNDPLIQSIYIDDAASQPVKGFVDNAEMIQWSNTKRVQQDRDQFLALGIQPIFGEEISDLISVAAVAYTPDLPADHHVCAPVFTRFALNGRMNDDGTANLARLYMDGPFESSVYSVEHLRLGFGPDNMKLLSWRFRPNNTEVFETQSIDSGARIFASEATEWRKSPLF